MINGQTPTSLGLDIPVCTRADATGCVVAYNARGPRSQSNRLDFADPERPGIEDRVAGRLCVNPLSWRQDEKPMPASAHLGALFFDSAEPKVLSGFADATCHNGRLLVTEMGELPDRDFMSGALLWIIGPEDYHPIEYQLFYVNLRQNAVDRVRTHVERHGSAAGLAAPSSGAIGPDH